LKSTARLLVKGWVVSHGLSILAIELLGLGKLILVVIKAHASAEALAVPLTFVNRQCVSELYRCLFIHHGIHVAAIIAEAAVTASMHDVVLTIVASIFNKLL